jgi:hypothetical protein
MAQTNGRAGFRYGLGLACIALSSTGAAAVTEPGQLQVASGFLDEVLRAVLPARLDLPRALADAAFNGAGAGAGARTASLAELKFCGVAENGAGRFRAVVLQNSIGRTQSLLAGRGSCEMSQGELANPAASLVGEGQSLVIADVEAVSKGGELTFWLAHAVAVHGGARGGAPVPFEKRTEIGTLPMAALQFDWAGAGMYFHVAPTFGDRSVGLVVAVSENPKDKGTSPVRGTSVANAVQGGQATLAAEVPLATINLVLGRLSSPKPLTIALEGDAIELRAINVQTVGSSASKVTVTGTATPQSIRETVAWTLVLTGDPLSVASVHAAARLEDCAGQGMLAGMACDLRNGGRTAAAQGFAAALTNRYGGRPLHELVSPIHTRFSVAGRRVLFGGDLLRVVSGRAGVAAAGTMSVAAEE